MLNKTIDAISNAFVKITDAIGENPMASVAFLGWLTTLAIGYLYFTDQLKIYNHLNPSSAEETMYFHKSTKVAELVNDTIEKARSDLHASKILIAEFHNNKRSLASVPWNYYSVRFAAIDPVIEYKINESQDIPNTLNAELYSEMWPDDAKNTKCIVKRVGDIKSSMLRTRIENRNNRVFYACPIQTSTGVPLGWVSVNYNFNNYPSISDDKVLAYLENLTASITPALEDTFVH